MPTVDGPSCPLQARPESQRDVYPLQRQPLVVEAGTLAEALAAYTAAFGVRFRPYDGSAPLVPFRSDEPPKYFIHESPDGSSLLVDIHVRRGSQIICPKQDLNFRLQPTDRVEIGLLAC